jgi:hypothetical protein
VRVPVGASLADVERRLIQKTLEFARGNKPKAAQLLKLSLKTIYNKIKEYGLEHWESCQLSALSFQPGAEMIWIALVVIGVVVLFLVTRRTRDRKVGP